MKDKKYSIIKYNINAKLFIIFALLFTSLGVVSYATIITTKTQEGENSITTGCFETEFNEQTSITLNNAYPTKDEDGLEGSSYQFSLKNKCNIPSAYYVLLSTTNDSFDNKYIRYSYNDLVPNNLNNARINDMYKTDDIYSNSYILAIGTLGEDEDVSYNLKLWLDEKTSYDEVKDKKWEGQVRVVNTAAILNIVNTDVNFGFDSSYAKAPNLKDNLIPVVYDENKREWIKTSAEQIKWYNYDRKIWANAVTVTDALKEMYVNAASGTIIPENAITGMYVWVPRFTYKNDINGNIDIKFSDGMDNDDGYIVHPAFQNGSSINPPYQYGGWNEEISGFWYAKFETGGTLDAIRIKPNIKSLTNAHIINFYQSALGVREREKIDYVSHMSKNSEWGAVVYLSLSKYGINKDVMPNNSEYIYTGRSAGTNKITNSVGSYEYNSLDGMTSSTTGNIYGIYDMAGGASEYVMAFNSARINESPVTAIGNVNLATLTSNIESRLFDHYNFSSDIQEACQNTSCTGHALNELASRYVSIPILYNDTTHPFLIRGGDYSFTQEEYNGILYYNYEYGTSNIDYGFRIVLT